MDKENLNKDINQIIYPRKTVVVGITGLSRSGKSTLTKKLAEHYKTENIFHMDNFLIHKGIMKNDPNWNSPIADWEDPKCYDMDECKKQIITLKAKENLKNNIIIVDGFLLFLRKDIADLCDFKIYIEIDKEIARERRKSTKFYHSDYYFDEYIWKCFHSSL